jgi:hypothetical protein
MAKDKHDMDAKAYARIMASAAKKLGEKIGAATGRSPPPPTEPIGPRMQSGAFTMQEDVIKGGGKKGFIFGGQVGQKPTAASYPGQQVYDPSAGGYNPFIGPLPESGYAVTGPTVSPDAATILEDWHLGEKTEPATEPMGPRMQTGGFTLAEERPKRYTYLENYYSRLGTEIRKSKDPIRRGALVKERNKTLEEAKKLAAELNSENPNTVPYLPGKFPNVDPDSSTFGLDFMKTATTGKIGDVMTQRLGKGAGYDRGDLFRGTSYQSTGAINGVMRALAGIFILFVFIGVFYMVFGPIYDSLIFNFTNIVSADGDATLGGKSIPTLFDNTARVILVWVPLIVVAGALYKLTALVFEREVGTRTTEETEWDMLGAIEDSTDLDAGSDPSVFEAYGGGW